METNDNYEEFKAVQYTPRYRFDFDKIKTIDDLIAIVKALDISFGENYPKINDIRHLLKEIKE